MARVMNCVFLSRINEESAGLAGGFEAVCVFVNDQVNAAVIATLHSLGVRLIALRCAGYNHLDVTAAKKPASACISTKPKANGKRKSFYGWDNQESIIARWG
jgi:lactate dehydrogenase-like 2-hydroxyacid dehydrogenase